MLRSKIRDHNAQAQRSEPSPKENKLRPRKQMQGDHEREETAGARDLKPKKKKHQEARETHVKRLKKK